MIIARSGSDAEIVEGESVTFFGLEQQDHRTLVSAFQALLSDAVADENQGLT